jgi:hypothetical protein
MATKLQRPVRREIEIDGEPFTVSISGDGIRLTRKRFRSGVALSWKSLWSLGTRNRPGEQDRQSDLESKRTAGARSNQDRVE